MSHVAWHLALSPIIVVHAMVGKHFSISSFFSGISLGTRKGKNHLFLQRSLPFFVLRSYSCLEEIEGFGAHARLQGVFLCFSSRVREEKLQKSLLPLFSCCECSGCAPLPTLFQTSPRTSRLPCCDLFFPWRLLATFGDFWRDHDFDVVKGDQVSQTVEFPGISQEFFFLPWMPNTNNELFSSWDLENLNARLNNALASECNAPT